MEKRKYKKRNGWGPRAECLLLELWAEKISELRSARKNGHIYKSMAAELQKHQVITTDIEVKSKLQNLSTKYRIEKRKVGITGGSPSNWEHYNSVHKILGTFKFNNVDKLIEDSLLCEEMTSSPTSSSTPVSSTLESPMDASPSDAEETVSASCAPSTSNSAKKRKQNYINEIYEKMELLENKMDKQHQELVQIAKEMAETDKRNSSVLEEYVKSNVEMNNAFIEYLKKKDS